MVAIAVITTVNTKPMIEPPMSPPTTPVAVLACFVTMPESGTH